MSTSIEGSSSESKPSLIQRLFGRSSAGDVGEEIQTLIEEREETEEPLSQQERELIASALRFNALTAEEVGVPRNEIGFLDKNDDFEAVMDKFAVSGYSRMPVCGEGLDETLGFLTL